MASIEIMPRVYPIQFVLPILLMDHTTKKNIIFATDSYLDHGDAYGAKQQITEDVLMEGGSCLIQPRVLKAQEEQLLRTRRKAEVFTPAWVCCLMNDHCDAEWFGRENVFTRMDGHDWTPTEDKIVFPDGKHWQDYVDSRRLEITCGEAPYLVSRYEMGTGEIIPIDQRIGILDRKLRIVSENVETEVEWLQWTIRAFQAVYGYEYQGDNLLIARINLMMTFTDYLTARWQRSATKKELTEIARIISRNVWQMDGLQGTIPMGALYEPVQQLSMFDMLMPEDDEDQPEEHPPCSIYDWRSKKSVMFNSFQEGRHISMKFDFIIGNPPYQDTTIGDNDTYAPPIYDKFMDATEPIGNVVELIHPARFLFNAGSTPKAWNKKMLEDKHFKILKYYAHCGDVFPGTDIKGGIVVSLHAQDQTFIPIGIFTQYDELNTILRKVRTDGFESLKKIVVTSYAYHLTEKLYEDHPECIGALSNGHEFDFKSNVFEKLPSLFFDSEPNDGNEYVRIMGRIDNTRIYKYIRREYVNEVINLSKYKVFMSGANGAGHYGETLYYNIGYPNEGSTETYLSVGSFGTEREAESAAKYISTKFCRSLLGVRKVTQALTPGKFEFVPLQDFSSASDIDWSQPVAGIDQQLYRKYGLTKDEITFIETHVKEMV